MPQLETTVGSTADGLVVLRSSPQAALLGVEDPYAEWFVTPQGERLAHLGRQVDPLFEPGNLARYLYTTALLRQAAPQHSQLILLGAGFDCRALWLAEINTGRCQVFELDTQEKLGQKQTLLEQHGVPLPAWDHLIPCDLRKDDPTALLAGAGLNFSRPALVLAEGLVFYLPPDLTRQLLATDRLLLAPGSRLVFDCWAEERIARLNRRVEAHIGLRMFQPFPFPVSTPGLQGGLQQMGYQMIEARSLTGIASQYYQMDIEDETPSSWWIVQAEVPPGIGSMGSFGEND